MTAAGERRRRRRRGRRRTARSCCRPAGALRPARARRAARWRSGCARARAVGQRAVDRGGDGRRRVDDQRSPARKHARQVGERDVLDVGVAVRHQQPHVVATAAPYLGRLVRLERRVERDRERGVGRCRRAPARRSSTRPPRHVRDRSGDRRRSSATSPGTTVVGQRPVGDVFARERVLVHLGAHVAGIDHQHAHVAAARPRAPPTAARARPSTSRSRPSLRTPRPRRRR